MRNGLGAHATDKESIPKLTATPNSSRPATTNTFLCKHVVKSPKGTDSLWHEHSPTRLSTLQSKASRPRGEGSTIRSPSYDPCAMAVAPDHQRKPRLLAGSGSGSSVLTPYAVCEKHSSGAGQRFGERRKRRRR